MYIIVGLGNPGAEYRDTRHNLGFLVVDRVASRYGLKFRSSAGCSEAVGTLAGEPVVIIRPRLFMNNSGETVRTALSRFDGTPGDLVVCCDDFHLPFGRLRLRKRGGDGGHNGLGSVIREVGTGEFTRLRCGIGGAGMPDPGEEMAGYVLSPFTDEERSLLPDFIVAAADAIIAVVRDGVDRAMNSVHQQ